MILSTHRRRACVYIPPAGAGSRQTRPPKKRRTSARYQHDACSCDGCGNGAINASAA